MRLTKEKRKKERNVAVPHFYKPREEKRGEREIFHIQKS
jgi:hypothetical protein